MPSGLLVDWGGVMTTSPFAAFSAFCAAEGLDPAAAANAFRHDRGARALLKDFETGAIDDAAFSTGFGALLGIADADGLAARLMGDLQLVEPMHDVVRRLRAAGVRTGMLSNSWGKDAYPRPLLPELFDVLVISGEERTAQARSRDLRDRLRADGPPRRMSSSSSTTCRSTSSRPARSG